MHSAAHAIEAPRLSAIVEPHPADAYVFALYRENLPACLRESLAGVPESLKALSQIACIPPGAPVLFYTIDQCRLYHAGWRAEGAAFLDASPMAWHGGRFPYRLSLRQTMPVVLSLPIARVEEEIHAAAYRIGIDRYAFKAAAAVWLSAAQTGALLAHPDWRMNRQATAWARESRRHAPGARLPLSPALQSRERVPVEARLTLCLQRDRIRLQQALNRPFRIVDTFHFLTSSHILRGTLAGGGPPPRSILECQGEIDMLAVAPTPAGPELWVWELKTGALTAAAVEQLWTYTTPLRHSPLGRTFTGIRPVWVGAQAGPSFRRACHALPGLLEPLVITADMEGLRAPDWWNTTAADLHYRLLTTE